MPFSPRWLLVFLALLGSAGAADAQPRQRSQDEVARELMQRRAIERQGQRRQQLQQDLTPQRSRPIPPTSPGSQVVPNR